MKRQPGSWWIVVVCLLAMIAAPTSALQDGDGDAPKRPAPMAPLGDVERATGALHALLIGVGDYKDQSVPDVPNASKDVLALYLALTGSDDTAGERVSLLNTGGLREPSRRAVVEALDATHGALSKEDVFLLAFVGHVEDHEDEAKLLLSDAGGSASASGTLAFSELLNHLERTGAGSVVLLMDAGRPSREGAKGFGSGSDELAPASLPSSGWAMLLAAEPGERSWMSSSSGHGLFMSAVLSGLEGAADTNADGMVLLSELASHVTTSVPELAEPLGVTQRPTLQLNLAGDPVIAGVSEPPVSLQEDRSPSVRIQGVADFFPVSAGREWRYHATGAGVFKKERDAIHVRRVVDEESSSSSSAWALDFEQGSWTVRERVAVTGEGIVIVSVEGLKGLMRRAANQEGDELVLPEGVAVGDEWVSEVRRGKKQHARTVKRRLVGIETVTVPAGTFEALHVQKTALEEHSFGPFVQIESEWYARGIGLVKWSWVDGDQHRELESFVIP